MIETHIFSFVCMYMSLCNISIPITKIALNSLFFYSVIIFLGFFFENLSSVMGLPYEFCLLPFVQSFLSLYKLSFPYCSLFSISRIVLISTPNSFNNFHNLLLSFLSSHSFLFGIFLLQKIHVLLVLWTFYAEFFSFDISSLSSPNWRFTRYIHLKNIPTICSSL